MMPSAIRGSPDRSVADCLLFCAGDMSNGWPSMAAAEARWSWVQHRFYKFVFCTVYRWKNEPIHSKRDQSARWLQVFQILPAARDSKLAKIAAGSSSFAAA